MKKYNVKMPALKMRLLAVAIAMMTAFITMSAGNRDMITVQAAESHPSRVVDEADILTNAEETDLLSLADEISERQQFDIVIVTVESLDGNDIQYYAADYYDYNGYGMGENYDGAMFIISMEEREWFVLTTGYGIDVLTDAEIDDMSEDIVPYLSDGEYEMAFRKFAVYCDKQLAHEKGTDSGATQDGTSDESIVVGGNEVEYYDNLMEDEDSSYEDEIYYEENSSDRGGSPGIVLSVIIGLVLALFPVLTMRGQLKSVHMQSNAGGYEKRETRKITVQRDTFLYHTVNRVPKPKENKSSGGSSSTFRGSSGRSHGGRGGRF